MGVVFLCEVAGRFGIWEENTSPASFKDFMEYTAKVNSFMPAFTIPFLAWAATIAETFLGITLILGIRLRFVALAAAGVLGVCWSAQAVSVGMRTPLHYYVVFSRRRALSCAICPIRK